MAKKQEFQDDGRTVANMNVEGLPWYLEKKQKQEADRIQLTKEEGRAMLWGIVKASLLVAGVFLASFTIFILLCVFVFFR